MSLRKNKIKRVVLIVADTLRADKINSEIAPNISKLASESIVFDNAYTTITKTDPSISSIMTGKYPVSLGLVNHATKITPKELKNIRSTQFLPEILGKKGYKTIAIDWLGRWHKRGYQSYSGKIEKWNTSSYSDKPPLFFFLRYFGWFSLQILNREISLRLYYAFTKKPKIPYDSADIVIDRAIREIKKTQKSKAFMYVHLWDAHYPHTQSKGLKSYILDTVEDTYENQIKFMDGQIGKLYDFLSKSRMLEDTAIILTSDHGENFSGPGQPLSHQGLTEDVTHIPLIIKTPGTKGKKISSLVQETDIFPTILSLLRLSIPEDIDGENLLPLVRGQNNKKRNFAYFEDLALRKMNIQKQMIRRRGIRVGRYKYIQTFKGKKDIFEQIMPSENMALHEEELYDLEKNPKENENIIGKKPTIAADLRQKIDQVIRESNLKRLKTDPQFYEKVRKSLEVIKKAYVKYPADKVGLAWTGGKDSTVLLHLVRLAFNGKMPFKVIFNDSTMEFDEIYEFIKKIKKLWNIDLITIKHSKHELAEFYATEDHDKRKRLSRLMKITAINSVLKKYKLKAFIAGIRWDEHESRSKESYFSKRSDHMRVHPILHFTEKDIWKYMYFFGVPYVDLYKKGYRSLGEKPFTKKATKGGGERSGRERDKEKLMGNLRKLGYW